MIGPMPGAKQAAFVGFQIVADQAQIPLIPHLIILCFLPFRRPAQRDLVIANAILLASDHGFAARISAWNGAELRNNCRDHGSLATDARERRATGVKSLPQQDSKDLLPGWHSALSHEDGHDVVGKAIAPPAACCNRHGA